MADGDLRLFQTDETVEPEDFTTVERIGGELLSGFAAGGFPGLRDDITNGGYDAPASGDIRTTFGEITTALEFELSGNRAVAQAAIGKDPVLSPLTPPTLEVTIDIKPDSDPNSINPRNRGVIPVAILGDDELDVTTIDVSTLRFGPDEAPVAHPPHGNSEPTGHLEDVNDDGFMDLLTHYRTQETGIADGDTEACLIGALKDSERPIEGCDGVRTVGKPTAGGPGDGDGPGNGQGNGKRRKGRR